MEYNIFFLHGAIPSGISPSTSNETRQIHGRKCIRWRLYSVLQQPAMGRIDISKKGHTRGTRNKEKDGKIKMNIDPRVVGPDDIETQSASTTSYDVPLNLCLSVWPSDDKTERQKVEWLREKKESKEKETADGWKEEDS